VHEVFWHLFDARHDERFAVEIFLLDDELDAQRSAVRFEHVVEGFAHRRRCKAAEPVTRTQRAYALQVAKHCRLVAHRVMDKGSHFKEQEKLLHRKVGVPSSEVEGAKRRPEVGILVGRDRVVQEIVSLCLGGKEAKNAQKPNDSKFSRHMIQSP